MNAEHPLSVTGRTRVRRHAERARTDRRELYAVLDAGMICHLGVVAGGSPVVLPTAYGRLGDTLYLHGSSANRTMLAAAGQQVCVTVTPLDALVCARSVFHNSVNYRSAMVFGVATLVTDREQRLAGLRAVTEQLIPGGWAATRTPSRKELAATAVLALPLAEASVKIRTGPPVDDPADVDPDVWAGQVPVTMTFGEPHPDLSVRGDLPVPDHIMALMALGPAGARVRREGG